MWEGGHELGFGSFGVGGCRAGSGEGLGCTQTMQRLPSVNSQQGDFSLWYG